MEAMRLGTLPIVAPTGGLKDTVEAGLSHVASGRGPWAYLGPMEKNIHDLDPFTTYTKDKKSYKLVNIPLKQVNILH